MEIGQLTIVIALTLVLRFLSKFAHATQMPTLLAAGSVNAPSALPPRTLAPRWILLPASGVFGALGLYWFVARVWFVSG